MTSRDQLAFNVTDLKAATRRYRDRLASNRPRPPGYVNFAIEDA